MHEDDVVRQRGPRVALPVDKLEWGERCALSDGHTVEEVSDAVESARGDSGCPVWVGRVQVHQAVGTAQGIHAAHDSPGFRVPVAGQGEEVAFAGDECPASFAREAAGIGFGFRFGCGSAATSEKACREDEEDGYGMFHGSSCKDTIFTEKEVAQEDSWCLP